MQLTFFAPKGNGSKGLKFSLVRKASRYFPM
jgi:hypothetical protein